MPEPYTITIPWPPKYNDPNSRTRSHMAKSRHIKKARETAYLTCLANPQPRMKWREATAHVVAYHKTNRFRDEQNITATLKATIDGVEDAGVIENDAGLTWGNVTRLKDKENPRVVLTITQA